jgi:sec-independent protein translocase protein TatB
MFDIGFMEVVVIGVVALIVLGPERLPIAARTLGKFLGKARASWENLRAEVEREIEVEKLKKQMAAIPDPGQLIDEHLNRPLRSASADIERSIKENRGPDESDPK